MPWSKRIALGTNLKNENYDLLYQDRLYSILTHEVYHALSYDEEKDKNNFLTQSNASIYSTPEGFSESVALMEVLNEKAADRTAIIKLWKT